MDSNLPIYIQLPVLALMCVEGRDSIFSYPETQPGQSLSTDTQTQRAVLAIREEGCSLLVGGEEKNEPLTSPTQLPVLMDHVCQWGMGGEPSAFLHFLTH